MPSADVPIATALLLLAKAKLPIAVDPKLLACAAVPIEMAFSPAEFNFLLLFSPLEPMATAFLPTARTS